MNVIESQFLLSQWDFYKNDELGLNPNVLTVNSNKKAYFICEKGHSYYTSINNKNRQQTGCPICTNKIIIPGVNDLEYLRPDIAKMWDVEKNGDDKPNMFSINSNRYFWWKCNLGHSFKSNVYCMVKSKKGLNCPYCRRQVVLPGFNDLATTNPALAKEWNYEKNGNITPSNILEGSPKKYWWKCKNGHEWEASLASRSGNNCPYCAHQIVEKGVTDFESTHPELLYLWNYKKNKVLPSEIFPNSNRKYWWICNKGHEWETSSNEIVIGKRCPICAGRKVLVGFNDLLHSNPEIAKSWNYEKNKNLSPTSVTAHSQKKVWWVCEKGHEWQAIIYSRVSGRNCPICAKETMSSLPEKAILFYVRKYFADVKENVKYSWLGKREFDIFVPSLKLAVEYDGGKWHSDVENDLIKDKLAEDHKIVLIRVRDDECIPYDSSSYKILAKSQHGNLDLLVEPIKELFSLINRLFNLSIDLDIDTKRDSSLIMESLITFNKNKSLGIISPNLLKEWNYEKNGKTTPEMVTNGSQRKFWWKCDKGHEWLASVSSRTRTNSSGCPYCSNHTVLTGYNDLLTKNPLLAKEFDLIKNGVGPEQINYVSQKKYWWKCDKGHEWQVSPTVRNAGHNCPYCQGRYAWPGYNDLLTMCPAIAKEFDIQKNYPVTPDKVMYSTHHKYWWKCNRGHSYKTVTYLRTVLKTTCPVCSGNKIQKGYNDLSTLYPDIARLWNCDKNKEDIFSVGISSKKKKWWKCEKGHEWLTHIQTIIGNKGSCPICCKKSDNNQLDIFSFLDNS